MDTKSLAIYKLLENPESFLEYWAKLKIIFIGTEHLNLYTSISGYYNKYSKLPSFADLKLHVRNPNILNQISAIESMIVDDDISIDIILDALRDEYTQEQTLTRLFSFVEKISDLDTEDIKRELTDLVLFLEEKTHNPEVVMSASDFVLYEDESQIYDTVYLGINNTIDSEAPLMRTELALFGGERGSGKSVIMANIAVNEYTSGFITPYFSIEMRGKEIFEREISILSGVPYSSIRKKKLSKEEELAIAIVRADMYENCSDLLDKYKHDLDFRAFETSIIHKTLRKDKQLVIVDNQQLTLSDIDANIQKLKAKFGPDRVRMAIVDYLNQIAGTDMYDWKSQVEVSKGLKNLARKHDILIVSPYQIDAHGEARFSKGILDAADIAYILKAHSDYMELITTKGRATSKQEIKLPIEWKTLTISPYDYIEVKDTSSENTSEQSTDLL